MPVRLLVDLPDDLVDRDLYSGRPRCGGRGWPAFGPSDLSSGLSDAHARNATAVVMTLLVKRLSDRLVVD
jgi:hypothetical protein